MRQNQLEKELIDIKKKNVNSNSYEEDSKNALRLSKIENQNNNNINKDNNISLDNIGILNKNNENLKIKYGFEEIRIKNNEKKDVIGNTNEKENEINCLNDIELNNINDEKSKLIKKL
jgi:hypothetical protein